MKENTVLTENAYHYILNEILEGRIKPGDRIREDQIAEQMGTSRTPVREAVNQLCQNGFIDYVKRKGLYCAQLTKEALNDLLEMRQVLEEYCYCKCAKRASEEDFQTLYRMIETFRSRSAEEQLKTHMNDDIQFHVYTAEITKSQKLIKYVTEIETLLMIARKNLKESRKEKEVIDLSWEIHYQMVKAMEQGNKDLIRELNHEHIKLMKDTM